MLRYAKTLEDVMKDYYIVPKDQARELFKEALEQVADELDIGVYEMDMSIDANIRTMEVIQEKVRKSF